MNFKDEYNLVDVRYMEIPIRKEVQSDQYPVNRKYINIPKQIRDIVDKDITDTEYNNAVNCRKPFIRDGEDPYMVDIIRGFRLMKGSSIYCEVGTRDKGNLPFVRSLMGPKPVIIDVDIEHFEDATLKFKKMHNDVEYHQVNGSSISMETINQISEALSGRLLDACFLDSNHMYYYFLEEFVIYWELVKPGGFIFVHDAVWEGTETKRGKNQALLELDRWLNVWLVYMNAPITRIMSLEDKSGGWGGLAIIQKPLHS